MKVLQVNTVCGRGSTGRIVTDLLFCLKENGHSGKIAYGLNPMLNAEQEDTILLDTKLEYYVHNILARFTDNEGGYSFFGTKRLISTIEKYRPDVIHLHNLHGHYLNYGMFFSFLKEKNIPLVWTFHDCWPMTGHCTHFVVAGCRQWKVQCMSCPQLQCYPCCYTKGNVKENYLKKKKNFTGLENLVIVTPSQWMAGLVKESFLKEYPVKVIHNGIDLSKFYPRTRTLFRKKYGLKDETLILGVASEWGERKGFNDFIRLAGKLSDNQRLIMVGVNEKQTKELPKSIITIKKTNSAEELAEIYSAADVFFNFTYEDNFPTVNLEAMACGTPVVTYRTGGSPESIAYQTGSVVEQGDYRAALELIDSMMKLDRNVIRERTHKRYEARDRYNEYLELYHSMIPSCK